MRKLKGQPAEARCLLSSRFIARTGRIIVAGGSAQQRKELRLALEFEGHQVAETETADRTLEATCTRMHHVLILNSECDGMEPSELCYRIRLNSDLGIFVVAGHNDTNQGHIDALNAGADDYIQSPFVPRELLARVRAVLRRVTRRDEGHHIFLQDRAIDLKSYKIRGPGSRVSHLTPKECLVLQCLVGRPDKAFTHQSLAQNVWQRDGGGEVEYLRIVIKQLRRKLEPDPENPRYILTERSIGYRFHMPQLVPNILPGYL